MAKQKAYADTTLCKGCVLCVAECPKEAILPLETVNKKGYPIIEVDLEACIGCGNCYRICPDYVFEIDGRDFPG